MEVTYATDFDSRNIRSWSGLGVFYNKMLKDAGFHVNYMENISIQYPTLHIMKRFFIKRLYGQLYSPAFNNAVSKHYASIISKNVKTGSCIFSPNTKVLAHLNNNYKKVLFTDATLERLLNFYPQYINFTKSCLKDGHEIQRHTIRNSNLLIYTSRWAADSAINYYNGDPGKVYIVPFGPNLDNLPSFEEVKRIIEKKEMLGCINLLFLGVDWDRKGGKYTLEVADRLNEKGIKTQLHVVGIPKLPPSVKRDYIINHGFISKGSTEGKRKIAELISKSHFLVLPTLADCTPVAFSEANAYGVPCIASKVGGNESIIEDDINGKVFPLENFVDETVEYIQSLSYSPRRFQELCLSSYGKYEQELNWNVIGRKIYKLVKEL